MIPVLIDVDGILKTFKNKVTNTYCIPRSPAEESQCLVNTFSSPQRLKAFYGNLPCQVVENRWKGDSTQKVAEIPNIDQKVENYIKSYQSTTAVSEIPPGTYNTTEGQPMNFVSTPTKPAPAPEYAPNCEASPYYDKAAVLKTAINLALNIKTHPNEEAKKVFAANLNGFLLAVETLNKEWGRELETICNAITS